MRLMKMFALVSAMVVVMGTLAFAKVSSRVVTFGQEFVVNGTTVKAGTYKLSFDDQSNELTIADSKSKQVVLKAKGKVEKRDKPGGGMEVKLTDQGSSHVLVSIGFPDEPRSIKLVNSSDTASN